MEDLEETLTAVCAAKSPSLNDMVALLRGLRQQRMARNDVVLRLGPRVLSQTSSGGLGDEFWILQEQVALAALERHEAELAEKHTETLLKRFGPGSDRVKKLLGMREELRGDYGAALRIYDEILSGNDANLMVRKRRVALLRAQGQLAAAAAELNATVEIFQGDVGSWQELAELQEKLGNLEAVAFCLEELVLLSPASHVYHCRLAETYAALRSPRLGEARKHLAQALNIAPKYARALHALATVCYAIATQSAPNSRNTAADDAEVNTAMWEFARDELRSVYEAGPLASAVAAVLARQEEAFPKAVAA